MFSQEINLKISSHVYVQVITLPDELMLQIMLFIPNRKDLFNFVKSCKSFYLTFRKFFDNSPKLTGFQPSLNSVRVSYLNLYDTTKALNSYVQELGRVIKLNDEKKLDRNYFFKNCGSKASEVLKDVFGFFRKKYPKKEFVPVVAGSSVLNCLLPENRRFTFGDIDVYIISRIHPLQDKGEHVHRPLQRPLLQPNNVGYNDEYWLNFGTGRWNDKPKERFDRVKFFELLSHLSSKLEGKSYYLCLSKAFLALSLYSNESENEVENKPIQFNFRVCRTIEELLCNFDLDCCRFAFDGEDFFTTWEGIRSLKFGVNFLDDNSPFCVYFDRLEKYNFRGFQPAFCEETVHPLLYYFSVDEKKKYLMRFGDDYSVQTNEKIEDDDVPFSGVVENEKRKYGSNEYIYGYQHTKLDFGSLKKNYGKCLEFHNKGHICLFEYDKFNYFILNDIEGLVNSKTPFLHLRENVHRLVYFMGYFSNSYWHGDKNMRILYNFNIVICSKCKKFYELEKERVIRGKNHKIQRKCWVYSVRNYKSGIGRCLGCLKKHREAEENRIKTLIMAAAAILM